MKILFLDIDGVMNCAETFDRTGPHFAGTDSLDPAMVARIVRVLTLTGAHVVLSSMWRAKGLSNVKAILRRNGGDLIADRLIDETPRRWDMVRGIEIGAWLAQHPEVTTFAIVDDDDDMGSLRRHLVKTTFEAGITEVHAERLIQRLGRRTS